jgi:pimeloyl-ACP methyl ester carboxylesterase
MSVQEGWANNKGVRIHYIDVDPHPPSEEFVPVLIVPGALHPAENYLLAASLLTPRRVVVPSLRGRGKSDAPQTGCSFQEHLTDIEAVVEKSELDTFCLMAYSLGVPYAIGYAIRHPQRVTGFIVGDFPAYYPALPPKWWEQRAVADSQDQVESHVIRALQRESSEVLH